MQLSLAYTQLVENLPRMQNFVGLSPTEAAHFSLKMTVLDELHCVVLLQESLDLYLVSLIFGTFIPTSFNNLMKRFFHLYMRLDQLIISV